MIFTGQSLEEVNEQEYTSIVYVDTIPNLESYTAIFEEVQSAAPSLLLSPSHGSVLLLYIISNECAPAGWAAATLPAAGLLFSSLLSAGCAESTNIYMV